MTATSRAPDRLTARDAVVASALALLAGMLYIATLQPDFGGPEDTPKFQFLGHVLGTAHPPGYPLYVMLTHVFVKLPIGTIAYRANLFSAVMAVLASVLVYVLSRQVGARPWASACAGLGLATGASFWRSAVFAEVYSLAACLAALTIALLVAWGRTGRRGLLFGAVAAFAAGLGNHLTLVGIVPGCVAYAIVRGRRALTLRVISAAAAIVALGLAQYGFILLRTRQHAPFLESRAESLADLAAVVTAQRFADQRFAFTLRSLLTEEIPVVLSTIAEDLGAAGVALLAIGAFAAARRRNADSAVLAGAAAGLLAMVVNLSGDVRGFITPVMVFLWPFCAIGAQSLAGSSARRGAGGMLAAALSAAAAAAMPAVNIVRNYETADQSRETLTAQFFRALHAELPDGAGVVAEDYFYDMALEYYRLTGEGTPGTHLRTVAFDADAVRAAVRAGPVFAFAGGSTYLAAEGLRFVPSPLPGPPLETWLGSLPRGALVAGATAQLPGPLDLSAIGHRDARPMGRPQTFEAFAAVARRGGASWSKGDTAASVLAPSPTLGADLPPLPGEVRAVADADGARVDVSGSTIVRSETGVALAIFGPAGALIRTLAFPADGRRRVPFQQALYRFAGETPCIRLVRNEWRDVSPALATGSLVAAGTAIGSIVVETEVLDAGPVTLHAIGLFGDAIVRDVTVKRNPAGGSTWLMELRRTGGRRTVFRLASDRPGVRARARLQSGVAGALDVCSHVPNPLVRDGEEAVVRPDFESEAYFGAGWGGTERTPTGPVRRGARQATLMLPLEGNEMVDVFLDITSAAGQRIDVLANGVLAGVCEADSARPCRLAVQPRGSICWLTLIAGAQESGAGPSAPLTFRGARIERRSGRP